MDARRPGAGRGHHRDGRATGWQEDDAQDGFLLDGFPRNVPQAETLKKMLGRLGQRLDIVLELVVDDDEVVRRLSGRRTCRKCGQIWHVDSTRRPARASATLRRRAVPARRRPAGDDPAPAGGLRRSRPRRWSRSTRDEGMLLGIDATGPVEEITDRAMARCAASSADPRRPTRVTSRRSRWSDAAQTGSVDPDQDAAQLALMREAGLVVGRGAGGRCAPRSQPGSPPPSWTRSPSEVIRARAPCRRSWATTAYPATICTSVNDEVVHGIPSPARCWRDGDLLSIDCGAIVDGWHGDAAMTVAGRRRCPAQADRACWRPASGPCGTGLAARRPGGRLTDIAQAVEADCARRRARTGSWRTTRSRHRHPDAPGPARAQLRPPGPRARCWSGDGPGRSSR